MFTYQRQIFLRETDATGVLLFSEQLNIALETLETFFSHRNFSLQEMINQADFLMPVVHAETEFLAPIHVGDCVSIFLSLSKKQRSSFTLASQIKSANGQLLGRVAITHVCVSKETGKSMPLPKLLLGHLAHL